MIRYANIDCYDEYCVKHDIAKQYSPLHSSDIVISFVVQSKSKKTKDIVHLISLLFIWMYLMSMEQISGFSYQNNNGEQTELITNIKEITLENI